MSRLIVIGAVVVVLIVGLAAFNYEGRQSKARQLGAVFDDLVYGHTLSGKLTLESPQPVCFDQMDAFRMAHGVDGEEPYSDRSRAVQSALMSSGHCTFADKGTRYDMTADGREKFTTPHGVVELWAN